MSSSNRHWPSMFKSKPCNHHHHHPWQHDMNPSSLISTSTICHRSPYTSSSFSSSGCDERNPEPKPRWHPKPEQIRILEAIFNSGMVNPPRDEIRKIRAQLQDYGQVDDANVFYWFQNRKSRSKHKVRKLQNSNNNNNSNNINIITRRQSSTPPPHQISPSSSSSSDNNNKSSPNSFSSKEIITIGPPSSSCSINGFSSDMILPGSPCTGGSVSNHNLTTYFQTHHNNNNNEISLSEPFFFPASSSSATTHHQGFCFAELSGIVQPHQHQNVGPCTSLLLTEMMNQKNKEQDHDHKGMKNTTMMNHRHLSFCVATSSSSLSTPTIHSTVVIPSMAPANTNTTTTVTVSSLLVPQTQGEETGDTTAKSIVYINDVAFEVAVGHFNMRAAFGEDAVLVHTATGRPVLTNEWGITLQSLQPGAFYFLI